MAGSSLEHIQEKINEYLERVQALHSAGKTTDHVTIFFLLLSYPILLFPYVSLSFLFSSLILDLHLYVAHSSFGSHIFEHRNTKISDRSVKRNLRGHVM